MVDVEELKAKYLHLEFARRDFVIDPANTSTLARLSGETRPEFVDPAHPAFEVYPPFIASLSAGRHLPIDFPSLGGVPMDGGKSVQSIAPVPAGKPLNGRTHLHDIYDKSGRSGRMIFLVSRMEIFDGGDNLLAYSDSRMVVRERGGRMSIERIADIGFGMEFGPWSPDTALGVASEAARSVGWVGGQRFTSHEGAREEGLPGALVPGILGMGFLCALIHRHIPAARIEHIDTVFRAPLIADEPCEVSAVVTDIDEDERRAELDLHVRNAAGETRIFGNATIRMPA